MIAYRCPRADLGCDSDFVSSSELDNHLRWQHGYRRSSRYAAAFRPAQLPPVGGKAAVAALDARRAARARRAAAGARGFRPAATTGATRASAGRLRRLTRRG
ncbi:hypothetical protein I6A60_25905 [Frankia sp. AgB1.9]|uniref:hypothetical protein n=1 Tax=unclassified Frankia TaxID=2632575 RepID=UPI001934A714|nr:MULTISPECIES: hypothetical protein [unclassified Frankia]MBL7493652.1 hypothetical protein [Frankia sp. AgW1.1]MBL7551273.1 hypothetical protein [Frankia sp. AgB1.9]